jgi:hypothetical protein
MKLTTHLRIVPRSKNAWSYTYAPPYAFMALCSVKAQGQLYLYRNTTRLRIHPSIRLQGEDGGSMVLRNFGILPHIYTASQCRRQLESSPPWKPQICDSVFKSTTCASFHIISSHLIRYGSITYDTESLNNLPTGKVARWPPCSLFPSHSFLGRQNLAVVCSALPRVPLAERNRRLHDTFRENTWP